MMVVTEEGLLAVVDRIYESIERPESWPETIYAIGELIGGGRDFWGAEQSPWDLQVSPHAREAGCHGTFFLSRADLRVLDQYAQEFGELIIRFLKIVFLSILRSQKDVGAREAIGLKMTRRYLQTFEPSEGNSASSRPAGRNLIAALWEDGRMFSENDLRSMRLLSPHLDRALRLQMRLNAADLRAHLISGALDCLTLGVVLVDRSGGPLWHNRRAQEIVNRPNTLRLSASGLCGRALSDTRSLRELIKGVVSAGSRGVLAMSRGLDLRPLLLTALPLMPVGSPDALSAGNQCACGVVFISDPDRTDTPTVESLRRAFDLTYREAQMAIAVARGHGLKAAADEMGVALTTARSQLQQAFAKTGTSHQAELAALVHRTLTPLRHD
jgi:DNA-binding CsgD family transcriptional regulator